MSCPGRPNCARGTMSHSRRRRMLDLFENGPGSASSGVKALLIANDPNDPTLPIVR